MYWTYMLLCENGAFYTGQTRRLLHRCLEHVGGTGARYTRANRPVRLVYYRALPSRSDALKHEHQLRQLSHAQKQRLVDQFASPPSLQRANRLVTNWQRSSGINQR